METSTEASDGREPMPSQESSSGRTEPAWSGPVHAKNPYLTPLTSIRFLAALHILLFHISEGERVPAMMDSSEPQFVLFGAMPEWFANILERGYCSTSLFFMISGAVLGYLYLDAGGRLTTTTRAFLVARLARIYPFHIAVVALIALIFMPIVTFVWLRDPHVFDQSAGPINFASAFFGYPIPRPLFWGIGLLFNALLVQAWFPEYALSGNFATWALSVVILFYLVFPKMGPWLAGLSKRAQLALMTVLPIVSLIPTVLYMATNQKQYELSFWSEFVMRFPLLWLPHFAMGILVIRYAGLSRHKSKAIEQTTFLSAGDVAAILALVAMSLSDEFWTQWLSLHEWRPNLLLRHGLLAPFFMVMTYDLASGRGILAKILSLSWLKHLGDTSFSIFILQLPFMIVASGIAMIPISPYLRLALIAVVVAGLAWVAHRYLDQPLSNWARKRLGLPTKGT